MFLSRLIEVYLPIATIAAVAYFAIDYEVGRCWAAYGSAAGQLLWFALIPITALVASVAILWLWSQLDNTQ